MGSGGDEVRVNETAAETDRRMKRTVPEQPMNRGLITEQWLLENRFVRLPFKGPSCGRIYGREGIVFKGYQTYFEHIEVISIWPPHYASGDYYTTCRQLMAYMEWVAFTSVIEEQNAKRSREQQYCLSRYIIQASGRYIVVFQVDDGKHKASLFHSDPRSSLLAQIDVSAPVRHTDQNWESSLSDIFVELLTAATKSGSLYYPSDFAMSIIAGWLNANPGAKMEFSQGEHFSPVVAVNGQEKMFGWSIPDIVHRKEYKFFPQCWE
jgi:hypothetical protein